MNQAELKAIGGPSQSSVQSIEGGWQDTYRDRTIMDLERVLGWARGSVEGYLYSGVEPTVVGEPAKAKEAHPVGPSTEDAYVAHRHPDDQRSAGLTDDEVLALIRENRRMADELERRITGDGPLGGAG